MLFKLIRIDAEGKETELPQGTYMIGEGKLLECDSEKIPFNVGCMTITKDKLTITPKHENKLFFKEKGSKKIQVLQSSATGNATRTLNNGDSFGLLRKSYWYEVSHCADKENQANDVSNEQLNVSDTKKSKNTKKRRKDKKVLSGINTSSESLLSTNESVNSKTSCSPEEGDVRKSKRKSASKTVDTDTAPAKPRERCIYGATCYSLRSLRRSNTEHKSQYSHPHDPDWGADELPPCPLGATCLRTGPLHWKRYRHPPHARQPKPVPRIKANKYWRRHSILSASDSDSPVSPIVLRKRVRRRAAESVAADSEPEEQDPYATEDSDEWTPTEPETVLDYYLDHF